MTVDIDGGPTDGDDPALEPLRFYEAEVLVDRVTVLEYVDDPGQRRWEPFVSYRFG